MTPREGPLNVLSATKLQRIVTGDPCAAPNEAASSLAGTGLGRCDSTCPPCPPLPPVTAAQEEHRPGRL